MKFVKCPFCSYPHTVGHFDLLDFKNYGKFIISCSGCRKMYIVQKDVFGVYAKPYCERL